MQFKVTNHKDIIEPTTQFKKKINIISPLSGIIYKSTHI
jgi:hypothetical protein